VGWHSGADRERWRPSSYGMGWFGAGWVWVGDIDGRGGGEGGEGGEEERFCVHLGRVLGFRGFWESCRLRHVFLVFLLFEAKVEWRVRVCCGWY